MISLRTNKEIQFVAPSDKTPPQYALEFFAKNGSIRPLIMIPQKDYTLDDIRGIIHHEILQQDLKLSHVIRYLYLVGTGITETLDENWVSFGVEIGRKGNTVNVFCMMDVKEEDDKRADGTSDPNITSDEDKWMALYLLFIYRYSRASNAAYQAGLVDKLRMQVASVTLNPPAFNPPKGTYRAWLNNKNFTKLVAAFDMFFCKFPNHDSAFLRFGTITSRFRDCASLLSLNHLRETAGIEGNQLFAWMFVGTLAEEAEVLMKENQELDKSDSYTPYMMDLGLSLKSPYSAAVCPGVYTWSHLICSLLVSTRSRNARMVSESNLANIRNNAAIVAYVHAKNTECGLFFSDNKDLIKEVQNMKDQSGDAESVDDLGDLPKSKDPAEWFVYLRGNQYQCPEEIMRFVQVESTKMNNSRPGSIGAHLYDAFAN
ncbi:nucleoprotein [Gray Lodge virus]|uniref:Nucleoprotein n=1 Tax=Gray Lodge virus TaxID=1272942 RepID=A0A0D3R1I0_9RHAB|nr:nucleoprotein [Gray Lodge virus]AJR28574.1 nucleoprotein [Gray Lodge virus]